jgi:CheY-like chemotaxis protein
MNAQLLVVDDELEIRDMLSRHFRYLGYDVRTAEDGADALAALEANKTDVVISDILMPNMDGIELLRAIRQQYPMVRVIMITGYVTMENVLACMRQGAETCIFKPIEDLSELEKAVGRAVEDIRNWLQILGALAAGRREGESNA